MTFPELAAHCGVTDRTVYRWRRKWGLPCQRVKQADGSWRYVVDAATIGDWLADRGIDCPGLAVRKLTWRDVARMTARGMRAEPQT